MPSSMHYTALPLLGEFRCFVVCQSFRMSLIERWPAKTIFSNPSQFSHFSNDRKPARTGSGTFLAEGFYRIPLRLGIHTFRI